MRWLRRLFHRRPRPRALAPAGTIRIHPCPDQVDDPQDAA
jgi:hypothetical protein